MSSHLRIAHLAGWYYPESVGGTEAYVTSLARAQQSRGDTVCVVAPALNAEEVRYDHDGIAVWRYPIDPVLERQAFRDDAPSRYAGAFERWLDDWRPDVVHVHSVTGTLGLPHIRTAKARGALVVLTVHLPSLTCPRGTLMRWGTEPCDGQFRKYRCGACWLQQRGLPSPVAAGVSYLSGAPLLGMLPGPAGTALQTARGLERAHGAVKEILALSDHVVVVCEWLRNVLLRNGADPERLTVARHGLPESLLRGFDKSRRSRNVLRVGYVGRYEPIKGVHVLVDAVSRIPMDVPIEVHLRGTAVGAGVPYRLQLEQAARSDPRIHVGGPLTDGERHEVMSTWHAVAVPSIGFETGPLVALEAFAAGLPVIGSDIGGISELVRDAECGVRVPPDDPAAWASALAELARRFAAGDWSWRLPPVRSIADVVADMNAVYALCGARRSAPARAPGESTSRAVGRIASRT